MQNITRRRFLGTTAAAGAVGATVAAPAFGQSAAELTAIPTNVVEKIKAWQDAHRLAKAATDAYAASLRVTPIDKAECDRCFYAMSEANKEVGPAREAMIFALWRV